MSDSASGLSSLRIRPRSAPPGVPTPPPSAVPPGIDPAPIAPQPEPVLPDMAQLPVATPNLLSKGQSRPPIPVSFSRPPVPAAPPLINSPVPPRPHVPPGAQPPPPIASPANPNLPPPLPMVTEEQTKYRLRAAPAVPPPATRAPAATVATPAPAPMQTSPLLAPRSRPEDTAAFRWGMRIFFVFGTGLSVAFLWLGWSFVRDRYGIGKDSVAQPPAAAAPANPADPGLPKKAIDRAKETVAAADATRAGMPEDASNKPTGGKLTLGKSKADKTKAMAAAALQISLEDYVARLKISGVAAGSKPRALIDGTMCYPGRVMDERLGITFESIDPERHVLVFRDATGATATARY